MYGELFELVAGNVEGDGVFAAILSGHEHDSSGQAVPLRLLGGLHRLVLDDRAPTLRRWYPSTAGTWNAKEAWPEILRIAAAHSAVLRAALDQAPQTNEAGRSAALIGGLLRLNHGFNLPIRLFEIGSSAGLNLRADRYHYRYPCDNGPGQWGRADSPVRIDDAWHGSLPPAATVRIVERNGYDIAPIDVTSPDGAFTVLSYVWPDQTARLDRLRGAIAIAHEVPVQLVRQTAAAAVAGLDLVDGALTVLWHSITWQYLSGEERAAVRDSIEELTERATGRRPFAHLTMEPARVGPDGRLKFLVRAARWPGGQMSVLGECHAHGPPVNWS